MEDDNIQFENNLHIWDYHAVWLNYVTLRGAQTICAHNMEFIKIIHLKKVEQCGNHS